MNKSEIAERAREFAEGWVWSHGTEFTTAANALHTDRVNLIAEVLIAWERAIAESQGMEAVMEFCARHTAGSGFGEVIECNDCDWKEPL